jgi:hypothetical protein
MMPAPVTDAAVLLVRALRISARAAGAAMIVCATDERSWASATFAGVRHHIDLQVEPDAATDDWLARLPEIDLPLRGHLVADLTLDRHPGQVRLEVLTIENDGA